jgi:DNA-binding beta-propeller fold protein YncE
VQLLPALGKGKACIFSGTGREMQLDNENAFYAAWAQPFALALAKEQLFVADSESSSIRAIDLRNHNVYTLAGGDPFEPRNLFAFGDQEGTAQEALFQHPQGLCYLSQLNALAVADTYNHRIKLIYLERDGLEVANLVGSGIPGYVDSNARFSQFCEPGAVAVSSDQNFLFVADTNNHVIRRIDLNTRSVTTVEIC